MDCCYQFISFQLSPFSTVILFSRANKQRATELRNEARRCRELAERKNQKVAEKERESRRMKAEAQRVGNHAEQLKRDRARALDKIARKQLHISGCQADIKHREKKIDEKRMILGVLKTQIEAKKAEAKRLGSAAGSCRAQADNLAMRGTTSRSLGQPYGNQLETAERKIYEARTKEQEASLLETEVTSHLITVSFSTSRFTSKYIISVERTGTIDQPAVQRDDRNRSKKVGIIRKKILKISKPCWGRFGNNLKKCTSGLEFKYFFWNPKHLCSGRTS